MKLELPPLDTIKNIRKKVGWTQRELAKSAEISQSMIAKIESGRKSPSYETAQKIFHVLNMALKSYNSKNSGTAKEIATLAPLLTTLKPGDTVAEAIQLMGSDYDQLPVIMEGKCVGCISSKLIITLLSKKNVQKTPVYEVMEEP